MNRFAVLRGVIKFLRGHANPMVKEVVLDHVLKTMSPNACANAVFTALKLNPDLKHWRFK